VTKTLPTPNSSPSPPTGLTMPPQIGQDNRVHIKPGQMTKRGRRRHPPASLFAASTSTPPQEHDEMAARERGATTDITALPAQPQQRADRHLRAPPVPEATSRTLPGAAAPASKGPRHTSPPTVVGHQRKAPERASPCLVGSGRGQPQPSTTPNSGGYMTQWRRGAGWPVPPLHGRILHATPHRAERREIPAAPFTGAVDLSGSHLWERRGEEEGGGEAGGGVLGFRPPSRWEGRREGVLFFLKSRISTPIVSG
jgi:hypothetical protein